MEALGCRESKKPDCKDILIYSGWPFRMSLDDDLAAGKAHISLFPKAAGTQHHALPAIRSSWS